MKPSTSASIKRLHRRHGYPGSLRGFAQRVVADEEAEFFKADITIAQRWLEHKKNPPNKPRTREVSKDNKRIRPGMFRRAAATKKKGKKK